MGTERANLRARPKAQPCEGKANAFLPDSGPLELVALQTDAFERLLGAAQVKAPGFSVGTLKLTWTPAGADVVEEETESTRTVALARRFYELRRRREHYFGSDPFSEPAWDILLDLYVAEHEGRRICVSSACIAAATPATTGLRWVKHLEAEGLIARETDPADGRRAYVRLSTDALTKMENLLRDALRMLEPGV